MDIQKYKILIIIIILLEPKGKRNFKIFEVEFVSEYNVFHLSTQHDSFFEKHYFQIRIQIAGWSL